MTEPYSPDRGCWHCPRVYDKPNIALHCCGPQTHYLKISFCSWECLFGWATIEYNACRRTEAKKRAAEAEEIANELMDRTPFVRKDSQSKLATKPNDKE